MVADTLARVFAATVNPAPKAAVRFPEWTSRTSELTIDHGYNIMSGAGDVTRRTYDHIAGHVARATTRGTRSP